VHESESGKRAKGNGGGYGVGGGVALALGKPEEELASMILIYGDVASVVAEGKISPLLIIISQIRETVQCTSSSRL
jgi:hypothetical protein